MVVSPKIDFALEKLPLLYEVCRSMVIIVGLQLKAPLEGLTVSLMKACPPIVRHSTQMMLVKWVNLPQAAIQHSVPMFLVELVRPLSSMGYALNVRCERCEP